MSRFSEWLELLAGDAAMVPAAVVLERFREMGEPEEVTTGGAQKILGRSKKFWRMACEAGAIEGAYRDAEDSPWRLPLSSCRKHLLRLANKRRGGLRGPNRKKASPAPPAPARAARLPKRPLLVGGHEAVGRAALRLEESA